MFDTGTAAEEEPWFGPPPAGDAGGTWLLLASAVAPAPLENAGDVFEGGLAGTDEP